MQINHLIKYLIDNGYPYVLISFDEEYPNEAFCIRESNNKWEVYYSERGNKTSLMIFNSESEACNNLLNKIKALNL